MSIQQIPYEILQNIFQSVFQSSKRSHDVFNCALVCHSWCLPASHVLFENIRVKNIGQLLNSLANQTQNQSTLCKVLEFYTPSGRTIQPTQYRQLLTHVPNVQTIRLNFDWNRAYDLDQIRINANLIQHVKEILLKGDHWKSFELQAYFRCATAFKESLRHMKFSFFDNIIITASEGVSGNTFARLSDFTCLTTLEIVNLYSRQSCMFPIIRSCSNLINFTLNNHVKEPQSDDEILQFDHSKLKYLDITIPGITEHHIGYMISNITRLKHFKLDCGTQHTRSVSPSWMESIGHDHLIQFQEYLSGIERVDFIMEDKSAEYWWFISGIINNKPSTATHVAIQEIGLNDPFKKNMVLKKRAESIMINCIIKKIDLPSPNDTTVLPALFQSAILPPGLNQDKMRSFHVIFNADRIREEKIKALRFNLLEFVMNQYTNLYGFSLKIFVIYQMSEPITVSSTELDECSYSHTTDIEDMVSSRLLESNRFAYVTLRKMESTQEITSILNVLPNTKYLKLHDCALTADDRSNYTIDFSNLPLKQLKLDITELTKEGRGKKTIMLQIEEKGINRTTCFKWKREVKSFTDMVFKNVEPDYSTKYGRLESPGFNLITIKFNKIELIEVYATTYRPFEKPAKFTLNLMQQ